MACNRPIVIVDDDQDIREALTDTLRDQGHEAVAIADGKSALDYLRNREKPCLVLLDWNMAPMSGAQVVEEIRADPDLGVVPVVLVTADVRAEEKSRLPGFAGYLKKPLDLDALFQLIEKHCA